MKKFFAFLLILLLIGSNAVWYFYSKNDVAKAKIATTTPEKTEKKVEQSAAPTITKQDIGYGKVVGTLGTDDRTLVVQEEIAGLLALKLADGLNLPSTLNGNSLVKMNISVLSDKSLRLDAIHELTPAQYDAELGK